MNDTTTHNLAFSVDDAQIILLLDGGVSYHITLLGVIATSTVDAICVGTKVEAVYGDIPSEDGGARLTANGYSVTEDKSKTELEALVKLLEGSLESSQQVHGNVQCWPAMPPFSEHIKHNSNTRFRIQSTPLAQPLRHVIQDEADYCGNVRFAVVSVESQESEQGSEQITLRSTVLKTSTKDVIFGSEVMITIHTNGDVNRLTTQGGAIHVSLQASEEDISGIMRVVKLANIDERNLFVDLYYLGPMESTRSNIVDCEITLVRILSASGDCQIGITN